MDSTVRATDHPRMRMARMVAIAGVALFSAGAAGAAGPPSFHLVFAGEHNASLLHQGTFTTSSPWCPSGTAVDVSIDDRTLTAQRRFTCDSGGDFAARIGRLSAEHGGSGSWQIVAGSGPLADLRGKGTFTSVLVSGDPGNPATITFRSTWAGVADFDATPPTIGVRHWRAKKLKRPAGRYDVRLFLSLTDNGGGPVSYVLQVLDSRKPFNLLALKLGKSGTGSATRSFRIKVGKRTRRVRLKVDGSDAVGNESAFAKTVRLG